MFIYGSDPASQAKRQALGKQQNPGNAANTVYGEGFMFKEDAGPENTAGVTGHPNGVPSGPTGPGAPPPAAPAAPSPSPTPQGASSPMASLQAAADPGAGWAQSTAQSQLRPGLGAASLSPMQRLFSGRAY